MARGVDELNWQELDRTQDIKMYWCKHLNSVHSVMMETVLKHIDVSPSALHEPTRDGPIPPHPRS